MLGDSLFTAERKGLLVKAMVLVWIGELWNVVEIVTAISAGLAAGSSALLAFGFKSIIELFLGGILLWQLKKELGRSDNKIRSEGKTLKLLGYSFVLLAIYVAFQSTATFFGWFNRPEESLGGIILVILSAVLMTILYWRKTNIAKKIHSQSLQKEATIGLACDLQDMTVLAGLGLNVLFGWWWADPLAALILIPFLLKQGRQALREANLSSAST